MRGINRRGLRLDLVAGLIIALAMPALSVIAAHAQAATATTLTAGTLPANSCSQPLTIAVTSGGAPVTGGTVAIYDAGFTPPLATVALSSTGTASPTVDLSAGSHNLTATFPAQTVNGTSYGKSTSPVMTSPIVVATECEFSVAVSNLTPSSTTAGTITLTPGQSGSATVTVTPSYEFTSTLAAPMYVAISCSGLPDEATCVPTPENLSISSTTPESCPSGSAASACPPTSSLLIETYAASSASATPPQGKRSSPIAWAMLPGALCLGGLAFGARRRRWLSRFMLLALIGLVTVLGATGCNPRYNYLNHGPQPNPATPAGTYTVTVTAQTNNGVTTTTHATSFVLVVN